MIPIFAAGCFATILGQQTYLNFKFDVLTVDYEVGFLSDHAKLRGPFIVGGCLVSLIGYIVLYTQTTPAVGYLGAIIGAMGVYPTIPVNLVWAGEQCKTTACPSFTQCFRWKCWWGPQKGRCPRHGDRTR